MASYTKPRENSVRNLQNLYSIVIGLSLVQAIRSIVGDPVGKLQVEVIPYFVSFFFILVPFYHGALRHLDSRYVEARPESVRSGALMADFMLLFLEAVLFLAISMVLNAPQLFAWLIVTLLLLDSAWGFLAYVAFSERMSQSGVAGWLAEGKWALINVITAGVMILFILNAPQGQLWIFQTFGISVAVICILRTILDYSLTWEFYFPPASRK